MALAAEKEVRRLAAGCSLLRDFYLFACHALSSLLGSIRERRNGQEEMISGLCSADADSKSLYDYSVISPSYCLLVHAARLRHPTGKEKVLYGWGSVARAYFRHGIVRCSIARASKNHKTTPLPPIRRLTSP